MSGPFNEGTTGEGDMSEPLNEGTTGKRDMPGPFNEDTTGEWPCQNILMKAQHVNETCQSISMIIQ